MHTMVRPERRCVELAGASPARVGGGAPEKMSAAAPGSRLQPRGEIPVAERSVKSLRKEGATRRAATSSEACSLDRFSAERRMGGPSRSCHGEGNKQRAETGAGAGTPRGMARSTSGQFNAEQERPSSAALRQGRDRAYKAKPKWTGSREGVRGAHRTDEGGTHKPPEGEGPALVVRATEVSARAWL